MPVDWKKPEAYNRLLAAIMAAHDMKLNYRQIATMYGEGATYDAIEGRFRIIKKEAEVLKNEVHSGIRAPAPARGQSTTSNRTTTGSSANNTPRKARSRKAIKGEPPSSPTKSSVLSGRVSKTPTSAKGKRSANFKAESDEGMASASFASASSTGAGISDDFSDLLVAGLPNNESLSEGQIFGEEDGVGYYDEEEDDGV